MAECDIKCEAWQKGYEACEGNWDIAQDALINIQQICLEYFYKPIGEQVDIPDLKEPIVSEEF